MPTNPDVVPGTQIVQRQFGMLRVLGPGNDRRITFEAHDTDGALLWRHEVRMSELRFPREALTEK